MATIKLYGEEVEIINKVEDANEMRMEFYGFDGNYEIYTNGYGKMYAVQKGITIWQI